MPRYVAPAGAPIGVGDIVRWASIGVSGDSADRLRQAMEARWGQGHFFPSCTGRAGLTLLFRAMRRLASARRTDVVVPSYTCYSVPAAAVKAGLRVRIVDVDPDTLDYERSQLSSLDFSQVLAVVATNLYGLPNDLPALLRIARDGGAFMIDDAAQAMGASVGGRLSGTWGDAGLFSFDKGKGVSSIDGGIVFTRSADLADALRAEWADLASPSAASAALALIKVVGYALMLRPGLYGVPARLPFLGLGRTEFTTEFPLAKPAPVLSALGAAMLRQLEAFTSARVRNACAWRELLGVVPGMKVFSPLPGANPAYVRLPVLVSPPFERDTVIAALNRVGIGATASYPASLADVPELQPSLAAGAAASGGRLIASRIMTLPTHPYLRASDILRAREVLSRTDDFNQVRS